jgi:hypothetical protein
MCITVHKKPGYRKNRTPVEKTENCWCLRTDFTKICADMSTSLHHIIGPRFSSTNHMYGTKERKALYRYWGWAQKSQVAPGGEDEAGKQLLFRVRGWGRIPVTGNGLAARVTHRLFHKCG